MKGDLHCHTKISDGSMLPEDVVEYAARIGLDCLAITDHDTMAGVAIATVRAENYGIHIIPGMEVSTFDYKHNKKVHILCYNPSHPQMLMELCDNTLKLRREAAIKMINKVAKKYPVDIKTVKKYALGSTAIYKQHIAMALTDMGYSLAIFDELYWDLFSSKKGWAYVETKLPDTREALSLIKEADGLAVLAHPGVYGNFDIIAELCGMGLDGIECFHPRQSAADEKVAIEAACSHGLLKTGGSDFHGMFTTSVNPLAARSTPEQELISFFEHINK